MRLSRLSYRSLLRLDIPYLPNLPPLTRVDPVRFNHIRRLLDDLELLFRVWREFVAFAIDLEGPVLDLAEDVDFFGRIDGFPKVLENANVFAGGRTDFGSDLGVELVALVDGKGAGHPIDFFERGRHD